MRSIVCNPQLVAECNHHEVMYVINPKKRNIQALRLDDIPFAQQTDCIRLTAITYQSFGLDKNKALPKKCFIFWLPLLDSNQRPPTTHQTTKATAKIKRVVGALCGDPKFSEGRRRALPKFRPLQPNTSTFFCHRQRRRNSTTD